MSKNDENEVNADVEDDSTQQEGEGDDVVEELVNSSTRLSFSNKKTPYDSMHMSTTFDWGDDDANAASNGITHFQSNIDHDLRFVGKTIVITGAGGQLGREGCLYFAQRGARIAALDRSKEGLRETFDVLNTTRQGGRLTFDFKPYVCDVTNAEQIKAVIDSIVHRCQKIDYLWNNAGYQGKIKPLLQQCTDDFKMTMDINVTGMFIVLQAVARKMVELQTPQCSIVNTSSVAGQKCTPCMQAYAASKAGVLALSINASKELAQYGIRVNSVSPALIGPGFLWDRQNKLHAKAGKPFFDPNPDVVAANKISQVPLARLGTPEEVVQTVSFLFSADSSYITGTNINVDGGLGSMLKA